jgi:hypothetical protein
MFTSALEEHVASKMSVNFYKTTQHYSLEDSTLQRDANFTILIS